MKYTKNGTAGTPWGSCSSRLMCIYRSTDTTTNSYAPPLPWRTGAMWPSSWMNPTLLFCMSLLAPFFSNTMAASTLFTAAAQCRADFPRGKEAWVKEGAGWGWGGVTPSSVPLLYCDAIPRSSTALTSAWQLMRSSNMPSTARRAARIKGVVPSCMRASRSVALFRIRICPREKG